MIITAITMYYYLFSSMLVINIMVFTIVIVEAVNCFGCVTVLGNNYTHKHAHYVRHNCTAMVRTNFSGWFQRRPDDTEA